MQTLNTWNKIVCRHSGEGNIHFVIEIKWNSQSDRFFSGRLAKNNYSGHLVLPKWLVCVERSWAS